MHVTAIVHRGVGEGGGGGVPNDELQKIARLDA